MFSGKILYIFAFVALCGVRQTHFSPEGLRPEAAFAHFAVLALSVSASQIQLPQGDALGHCRRGKAKSTTHFCAVLFLSGGDYRADSDHGDPLAVHARRSPGRAKPSLVWPQQKKHHTFLCGAFCSGGDYRDRTGDLLHAMQALSQLS